MGLSTHVLDTMHGCPAAGMAVHLYRTEEAAGQQMATLLHSCTLNADGRPPQGLLIAHGDLQSGSYRLLFAVSAYFQSKNVALPEPQFLQNVGIDFGVADPKSHYHVPLLVSPWSYSTYRGS